MSQRNAFQAKMIENVGGPLMAAVTATLPDQAPGRIAATMAELMTRSVQFGIALASGMQLKGSDEQADAIRLTLTALAGRLIGEVYRRTGSVPAETDLRKWVPALEAILAFADKFAPSADAVMRLERLEPGAPPSSAWPVDENQAMMQYMQAFVPVVAEVGAFSFGRQEKKLIQEVADRVSSRAEAMAGRLFPGAGDADGLQLKLGAAKALAQVYAECHREEKKRLQDMPPADRAALADAGGVSMDALWTAFEQRAAMLEILSEGLFGGVPAAQKTSSQQTSSGGVAPVSPKVAPIAPLPETPPPAMEAPAPEPVETIDQTSAPANPMGFFRPGAKKPVSAGQGSGGGDSTTV